MPDHYSQAVKSTLKLKSKGVIGLPIKKKKKRKDDDNGAGAQAKPLDSSESVHDTEITKLSGSGTSKNASNPSRTKAEQKFYEMQEKRQTDRIMKKAEKTHKQRVEDFNKHLDSLSEHYDIPKVSWTK